MSSFRKLIGNLRLNHIAGALVALTLVAGMLTGTGCSKTQVTLHGVPVSTIFPMTVTDDLGRTITLDKMPQRIVSLAPSNTEILFDLGLGDKVVGDTLYCNYPEAAQAVTKIGGLTDVDIEKVVSLNPDLILAEDLQKAEIIPALEKLGFKVYALVPHNLKEIAASVMTIGLLTGATEEARPIVDDMQKRIDAVTIKTMKLADTQKPSAMYVIWQDPLMSVGNDTPIYEMIAKSGGRSIVQDQEGFPTLSLESVIAANPQVVICNVDLSFEGGDAPLTFVRSEPRLKTLSAVVNGKVYGINADLTNRPVPRIIEGLEWIAGILHPELFPQFVTKYNINTFPSK